MSGKRTTVRAVGLTLMFLLFMGQAIIAALASDVKRSTIVPQRLWGVWGSDCLHPTIAVGAMSISLYVDASIMDVKQVEEWDDFVRVTFANGSLLYQVLPNDYLAGLEVTFGGQVLKQHNAAMRHCMAARQ